MARPAGNARAAAVPRGRVLRFRTWYALQQVTSYGTDGSYAFKSASAGVWCTLIGFALAASGAAAIGPGRV